MVMAKKPGPIGICENEPLEFPLRGSAGIVSYDADAGSGELRLRGPNGMYPASVKPIGSGGGTKRKRGVRQSRILLKMKVVIIESSAKPPYFKTGDSEEIVKAVYSELSRISKKFRKIRVSFDVSWALPSSSPASAATPKTLNVYMIENTVASINSAVKTAQNALPDDKIDGQEIANDVAKEGGFNIKAGETSVSFVSTTKLESHKADSRFGANNILANIILHEIGHGMEAEHDDKGLMLATVVHGTTGNRVGKYTKPSILKIEKFLSTL